ncbi:hypothetical protein OSTOST_00707, partial [Ostertagia ostertagi]
MVYADMKESAKAPILLLPKHPLTRLIVTEKHKKLFHAGAPHLISELRDHYLIPRIRRVVNRVISKCVACRRHQDLRTLQTLISEIEATLNTRPITPVVTSSTDSGFVLRPIDLINPYFTPSNMGSIDSTNISDSHGELIQSYTALQDALKTFGVKIIARILLSGIKKTSTKARVRDVVPIKQENVSQSLWPLGLIVQTNESVDGFTRSVNVKTDVNKFSDRSINQLIPLEVSTEDKAIMAKQKRVEHLKRIQPYRRVKRRTPRSVRVRRFVYDVTSMSMFYGISSLQDPDPEFLSLS